jgi:hypothetical protein
MQANQVGRQLWQAIEFPVRPSVFEPNVLTINIAELAQTLHKAINVASLWSFGAEYTDYRRC